MKKAQIQELIDLAIENDLTAIEVEEKEARVRIERNLQGMNVVTPVTQINNQDDVETPKEEEAQNQGFEVKSPLVGVFYNSSSPDGEAFVNIGSTVKEGEVLCIIESMKVMNEIATPKSGVIKQILVKKGDLVQFEQPLFIIE